MRGVWLDRSDEHRNARLASSAVRRASLPRDAGRAGLGGGRTVAVWRMKAVALAPFGLGRSSAPPHPSRLAKGRHGLRPASAAAGWQLRGDPPGSDRVPAIAGVDGAAIDRIVGGARDLSWLLVRARQRHHARLFQCRLLRALLGGLAWHHDQLVVRDQGDQHAQQGREQDDHELLHGGPEWQGGSAKCARARRRLSGADGEGGVRDEEWEMREMGSEKDE